VSELMTGIGIVLGQQDLNTCRAFDVNGSGTVEVVELVDAVGAALSGCVSE